MLDGGEVEVEGCDGAWETFEVARFWSGTRLNFGMVRQFLFLSIVPIHLSRKPKYLHVPLLLCIHHSVNTGHIML
jgi:hypothetical protein